MFMARMEASCEAMKVRLKTTLGEVTYVTVTADCWTTFRRWHRKGEGKSFFCFPSEKFDPNRRAAWVNAVKRAHPTDPRKAWEPSQQSRLCGAHFVTGKPSLDRHHPDHVPTLFAHRKQQPSLGRYERWKNRASTEAGSITAGSPAFCSSSTLLGPCEGAPSG
ncbi:hypothetical protein HPB47_013682 [Ixodes persulcatus]|uniref:Uncharacterized protein n=1 Tax=Ixodes persulcatus TaxID=34615 RepID=A0AC60R295_IXOPE|nr:hypothetical protein HPB47_013682 [Ixodes persulcatus]